MSSRHPARRNSWEPDHGRVQRRDRQHTPEKRRAAIIAAGLNPDKVADLGVNFRDRNPDAFLVRLGKHMPRKQHGRYSMGKGENIHPKGSKLPKLSGSWSNSQQARIFREIKVTSSATA